MKLLGELRLLDCSGLGASPSSDCFENVDNVLEEIREKNRVRSGLPPVPVEGENEDGLNDSSIADSMNNSNSNLNNDTTQLTNQLPESERTKVISSMQYTDSASRENAILSALEFIKVLKTKPSSTSSGNHASNDNGAFCDANDGNDKSRSNINNISKFSHLDYEIDEDMDLESDQRQTLSDLANWRLRMMATVGNRIAAHEHTWE